MPRSPFRWSSGIVRQPLIPQLVRYCPLDWLSRLIDRVVYGVPKLAVAAYMTEKPGKYDSAGAQMTRGWLFDQWARIAAAGAAVRVVVVEGSVRGLNPGWATYQQWVTALDACRSAGQQVYGYVPVAGGTRPPADVATEVQQWSTNAAGHIDGIYLDEGPTSCDPQIGDNYRVYAQDIRNLNLRLFVLAAPWPDNGTVRGQPDPWLRRLDPEFVQLWEEGVAAYRMHYGALDYCSTLNVLTPPPWWTDPWRWFPAYGKGSNAPISPTSFGHSARRVHAINDCPDASTMRQLIPEALSKGARTVWITRARTDPVLGSVYDELPLYWDEMVAFSRAL
jgi:hypothetical protein